MLDDEDECCAAPDKLRLPCDLWQLQGLDLIHSLILPGPFCPNRALLLLTPAHRSVPKDQDQDVFIRPRDLECSEQRS